MQTGLPCQLTSQKQLQIKKKGCIIWLNGHLLIDVPNAFGATAVKVLKILIGMTGQYLPFPAFEDFFFFFIMSVFKIVQAGMCVMLLRFPSQVNCIMIHRLICHWSTLFLIFSVVFEVAALSSYWFSMLQQWLTIFQTLF